MTPRPFFRRVFLPAMLTLLIGFMVMPALNVVRVDARGMGTEHASPWRTCANGLTAAAVALIAMGLTALGRLRRRIERASAHPLFKPIVAGVAVLIVAMVFNYAALFAAPAIFGATLTEGQHAGEFLLEERMEAGRPSRDTLTVLSGQNLKAGAVLGRVNRGIGRVSIPTAVGTGTGTMSQVYAGPDVQVGNYVLTCITAVVNGGVFSVVCPDGTALPNLTMTPGAGGTTKYRSRHINFTITDATDFIVTDTFTFVVSTTAPAIQGATGTDTISLLALGPDARPGNYRVICTAAVANGGVWQVFIGGPDAGESIGIFTMTPGSGAATAFETRHISFTLTDATDVIVGNYFDVCVFNNLAGGKAVAWDPTTYDGRNIFAGILYDNVDATSADTTGVAVSRDASVQLSALQWGAAISASEKISGQADMLKRGIVAR